MSKYKARKMKIGDRSFDSKKEGLRYLVLCDDLSRGKIKNLRTQQNYSIRVTTPEGDSVELFKYVADFVYIDTKTGEEIVEDVKSDATRKNRVYMIKKKAMRLHLGITIKEV